MSSLMSEVVTGGRGPLLPRRHALRTHWGAELTGREKGALGEGTQGILPA